MIEVFTHRRSPVIFTHFRSSAIFFYSSPGLIFFSWLVGGMIRLIRQRRLTFVVG